MYLDPEKLKLLVEQRDEIRAWVRSHGHITAQQRQLDADSPERVYWHYGYQAALTDFIDAICLGNVRDDNVGIPN